MGWRSIRAVLAGAVVGVAVTTLVDVGLHVAGVFPPIDVPIDDRQALLASAYRLVIGIGSAWLTARLAPGRPLQHALVLGGLGAAVAFVGVLATWRLDLGPRWYPISLVVLAGPQAWAGARLWMAGAARRPAPTGRA